MTLSAPEPRTVFSLALLLGGAVISSVILINTKPDEEKAAKPELSLAYYLDQAELTGTGADGRILYQVRTRRAAQTVGDESIQMQDVEMIYEPRDGLPWEMVAAAGRIPADASIIELSGNVVAKTAEGQNNETTIRTESLNIDPATLQASTDQEVVIEFSGREINATGMRADFESNQLNLLSNVNGKFVP
jgi:LPS export ABC transporter protein LptC